MQRTLLWKIALIGLVGLLLQIPVEMVRGLVHERKQPRDGGPGRPQTCLESGA